MYTIRKHHPRLPARFCHVRRPLAVARYTGGVTDIDWVAKARELARGFGERAAQHDRDGSFPHENFVELIDAGFARLTVPRQFGGYEVSLSTFLAVQEELAAGDGSTAMAFNMHLIRFGGERENQTYSDEWWHELCRGAVENGWLANTAATEEGLGSPAGGGLPETHAVAVEGGWLVNGRKTFTTMSPILHYFITMVRMDDPGGGPPGSGNLMIYRDDPGVRIDETWDSLGMRSTGSHDLVLEGAFIPADRQMKARGPAIRSSSSSTWFALGLSATTLGVARAARDYAVNFASERTPSGNQTIKQYPGVRTRVARIDLLLQRSRALILDAAHAWETKATTGMKPADRVAIAKIDTLNNCIEAVDLAMRVVGGVSLLKSRPMERYYRDVRAALHNPPMEDRALEQLAKSAFDD